MFLLEVNGESKTIYEYEDAHELIKNLAAANKDDLTPVSRGGKGRRKLYYYNYACSFDIETTTIRSGELGYYHPDGRPLGFPYLYQFNIYGCVIMVRQHAHALDVFRWLGEYFIAGEKKRLVIFDHNLGYEYQFFMNDWAFDYAECFALDIHHPVTLVLTNGLILKDSYKLTNMSLETLTKDWSKTYFKKPEIMDYNQLRTPYTALDAATLEYSTLDVLALSDAIGNYLVAHSTGVYTKSPTSTSFTRAEFKKEIGISAKIRTDEQKEYFKTLERCKLDIDIYNMLGRQARGGNTHLNRKYTGELLENLGHCDITSSYPTQLVCYPEYPVHYWRPLDPDCPIDTIKLFEANGFCTLFDVVLVRPRLKAGVTVPYLATYKCRTLKGVSSYSDNGRYMKGAEMLETTIFGIEWPIIEKQYDFDDVVILRGYFNKKGYLPDILRRFILKLYEKKTVLKNVQGSEMEYALSKAHLNAIYGMAFTRIIREKCLFDDRGIFETQPEDPAAELESYNKGKTRYFLNYAWGALCSTLGRAVYLQRMIDTCGDDFVYCDTDSVFFTHPEAVWPKLEKLEQDIKNYQRRCGLPLVYNDIKGRPHELGGIDREDDVLKWKSWGAKKYATVTAKGFEATIAGVPKYIYRKEGGKLEKVKTAEALLKTPEAFELGFVFKGRDTNKLCLWYNDDENITLYDGGRPFRVGSNIAMLPCDYVLGLSDDYSLCLQVEGVNGRFSFSQNHDQNTIEDFIN